MSSATPSFETSRIEAQAVCLMATLAKRPAPLKLKPEDKQHIDALATAFRQGNKARAFKLSQAFYKQVLSPEKIAAAYAQIRALNLKGNADFQVVMDSLKDNCADILPDPSANLTQDQALKILLLAITQSDKNSISYIRRDDQTGKPRPTTFPLTENLILHFLAPFGDKQALAKKVLVFSKIAILGNPAAWVAADYMARKRQWEKVRSEAISAATRTPPSRPEPPQRQGRPKEIDQLRQALDKLLSEVDSRPAQEAIVQSFQVKQLKSMLQAYTSSEDNFQQNLSRLYSQHLSASQAANLSTRLLSNMKRLMLQLGTWKEEYWQAYQIDMQKAGIWEGQAWLDKWQAEKSGKQIIQKTGADYLVEEKTESLDDLLAKDQQRKDKQKGQQMLSTIDISQWVNRASNQPPAEIVKVLDALSQPTRFQELMQVAFEDNSWQTYPEVLRQKLELVFTELSQTDLDAIKEALVHGLSDDLLTTGQSMVARVELQVNKLALMFKKERKLSFPEALGRLQAQQAEDQARERLNSKAYQNSAAARYGQYSP